MKNQSVFMLVMLSSLCLPAVAMSAAPPTVADEAIDRITARETETVKSIAKFSPLVETYVQTFISDKDLGHVPNGDHYFLGRATFAGAAHDDSFLSDAPTSLRSRVMQDIAALTLRNTTAWIPVGFAQMAVLDAEGFNREHYKFSYQRREMVGNIECLVFDVIPKINSGRGRFLGRIWVEDDGFVIVRFNGTFIKPKEHTAFLHFDSWRVNTAPGVWLPAYIYGEESQVKINGQLVGLRAQTRFWGYAAGELRKNEFTNVLVDVKTSGADVAQHATPSPVANERTWERQAENNVLDKLQDAGLLAPPSDLDSMLETVVDNILITNNLNIDPQVRCRVLLTAPLETFAVGHTIVISRGLLDVLPDEASLAAVLAQGLSHIVLGHSVDTKFAFSDRLLFSDAETLARLSMARPPEEEVAADKKAAELMHNSPYKDKLGAISLFMKQLAEVHSVLPNLVSGRMGNSLLSETPSLASEGGTNVKLDKMDIKQIAALPLGARIVVDPWSDHAEMLPAKTVELLTAREKMPFQVAPMFLDLVRFGAVPLPSTTTTPIPVAAGLPTIAAIPEASK